MFDQPFNDDLREIEEGLIPLMRFEPETTVNLRIVGAMRGQLRRERAAARWKFALRVAACAFIWLHVSFYVVPITDFHLCDAPAASQDNPLIPRHHSNLPDWPVNK
jgi:hypothetical protein